jgi:hypothetical protein
VATNNATNTSKPIAVSQGGTGASSMTTTDGTLYYSGTTLATTTTGTSGQVLTSNGSGSAPTYQSVSVGSGNLVLIQSQTSTGSASVNFTTGITSTYNSYYLTWTNVLNFSTTNFEFNVTTNGSFPGITTNYHSGCWSTAYNSATISNANSTSTVILAPSMDFGSSLPYASGFLTIFNATKGATFYLSGNGSYPVSGAQSYAWFSTINTTGSVLDGFQFLMASGNIAGTFTLYGILE